MIVMRSSHGLRNKFIDNADVEKVIGTELERVSSLGRILAVFPENRSTAFWADYRVVGVFHHENTVGNADSKRPSRSSLADDHSDNRNLDHHHLAQVVGDRFGNVPL